MEGYRSICSLLDSLVQSETNFSSTGCFLHEFWSIKQMPVIVLCFSFPSLYLAKRWALWVLVLDNKEKSMNRFDKNAGFHSIVE